MIQLIKKEYWIQHRQFMLQIPLLIVLIFLWNSTGTPIDMMYLFGGLVVSLSLVTGGLGYDEGNDNSVMKFLMMLPIKRKDIVVAKYITGVVVVLTGAMVTFFLVEALKLITGAASSPPWTLIGASILGNLITIAIILAVNYKFGSKNITFVFVGFVLLGIAGFVLYILTDIEVTISQWLLNIGQVTLSIGFLLVAILVYVSSMVASIRAMERKEL